MNRTTTWILSLACLAGCGAPEAGQTEARPVADAREYLANDTVVIDRSDLGPPPQAVAQAATGPGQLVYVNFNGPTIRNCRTWTDSVDNCSFIIANTGRDSADFTPWGAANGREMVLNHLRMLYEGYNVRFTQDRPASTTPYMMLVVSHTDPGLGAPSSPYRGISPLDCGNSYKYDVSFVIDRADNDDFAHRIEAVGKLAAHEVGHALGLEHVTDPFDVMYPNVNESLSFHRAPLRDANQCLSGYTDQDAPNRLNQWVGTDDLPVRRRLNSAPAVASMFPGHLEVFALGSRQDILHKWYYNGQWSGWHSMGGYATSAPSVVSWGNGRMDLFVRGGDYALWHRWYDAGTGWSGWESLGGALTSAPSAASADWGHLDVYVRGIGNGMHHKAFWGGWGNWEALGGDLSAAPSAVCWAPGRVDTFVRGFDYQQYGKWWSPSTGWSPYLGMGGYLLSAPAAATMQPGHLDVFHRGSDSAIWHQWYWGGWSGWESLGGVVSSGPGVTSWGPGRIDVFVRGVDYGLHHRAYENVWYDWHAQ